MSRSAFPAWSGPSSAPASFRWGHAPPSSSSRADLVKTVRLPCGRGTSVAEGDPPPAYERELERRIDTGRGSLPVLPRVASLAMRLASDPDAPFDELDALLRHDPPLAARLMSVANSVGFRRGAAVTNTRAAIGRLGLVRTRDLLFQAVYASSSVGVQRYQVEVQASIRRSVRCAAVAEVAARHLPLVVDGAYLIGLLHDIGETRIYRMLETIDLPSKEVAAQLVARHHEHAGRELATAWQLSDAIIAACGRHHDEVGEPPGPRLAQATDMIVDAFEAGNTVELAQRMGSTPEVADALLREAAEAISREERSA